MFRYLFIFIRFCILTWLRTIFTLFKYGLSKITFLNVNVKRSHSNKPNIINTEVIGYCHGNNQNSYPDHKIILRILMFGKEIGSVLGKRGYTIKKIREETEAQIYVSSGGVNCNRIIQINGFFNQVVNAFDKICDYYKQWCKLYAAEKNVLTMRILIPKMQIAFIIGKSGTTIRKIQEQSNSRVEVGSTALLNSNEHLVLITGNLQSLSKCIRLICHICYQNPCDKWEIVYYSPMKKVTSLSPYCGTQNVDQINEGDYLPRYPSNQKYPQYYITYRL